MPPKLAELFSAALAKPLTLDDGARSALLNEIASLGVQLNEVRDRYHPVFGLHEQFGTSDREQLLANTVKRIDAVIGQNNQRQVRILDVGCNLGFVAMSLARSYPCVIGIDANESAITFASKVSLYNKSSARFYNIDAIELLSNLENLDQVDCCLLLNMLHQVIFSRGLRFTQTFLAAIAHHVDFVFVELANKMDYFACNKADLLPIDASEIFECCSDVSIELLRTDPRRLYLLRRQRLSVSASSYSINNLNFAEISDPELSRKYFYSGNVFIKQIRFTSKQSSEKVCSETTWLAKLKGTGIAPDLFSWHMNAGSGYVAMSRLFGVKLSDYYDTIRTFGKINVVLYNILKNACVISKNRFYHNDYSPHNMIVINNFDVRIVDFEQADVTMIIDHFVLLGWILFDLIAGRGFSYEWNVYQKITQGGPVTNVDKQFYPKFRTTNMSVPLKAFVEDIYKGGSWSEFVERWTEIFGRDVVLDPECYKQYFEMLDFDVADIESSITLDDVIDSYRLILGREPESDDIIRKHLKHRTRPSLERQLRSSHEYSQLLDSGIIERTWHEIAGSRALDRYALSSFRRCSTIQEVVERIRQTL